MPNDTVNRMKEFLRGDPESSDPLRQLGLLKSTGLSVEQLARKIKVTRTSVYYYINKQKQPRTDTLVKLSELAGIHLAEMLTYCTPREPHSARKNGSG
jgi:predicted transcriptional regulator